MHQYKKIFLLLLTINISLISLAQGRPETDSIEKILSIPDSEEKLDQFLFSFNQNMNAFDSLKREYLLSKAMIIAKKLHSSFFITRVYISRSGHYYAESNDSLADLMLDSGFYSLHGDTVSERNRRLLTVLNSNKAAIYYRRGQNEEAIDRHLKSLEQFKKLKEYKNSFRSYQSIISIFQSNGQEDKANYYINQATSYYEETHLNDSALLFSLYLQKVVNNSQLKLSQKNIDADLDRLSHLFNSRSTSRDTAVFYKAKGVIYLNDGMYSKALDFLLLAIKFFRKNSISISELDCYEYTGGCYYELGEYENARQMFIQQKHLAQQLKNDEALSQANRHLGAIYGKIRLFKEAINYYEAHLELRDSLDKTNYKEKINAIENKFNYKQKEQENNTLEQKNKITELQLRQRNLLLYIFSAIIIVLILLGYSWWKSNIKHQELIQRELEIEQQKHIALEKEKELLATQATLKGQEEERIRIARDLHDGLGGILSGIKLTLSSIERDMNLSEDIKYYYDNILDKLDNAINEMRKVAYNMMPEALLRYGLEDALNDYCKKISTHQFKVIFQCYGVQERWEQATEISVYRVVQELITNAHRHAKATQCLVQIIQENNHIIITVEDDGCGFDSKNALHFEGIGLKNIQSRIGLLGGALQIESNQQKGSTFNIEFNI